MAALGARARVQCKQLAVSDRRYVFVYMCFHVTSTHTTRASRIANIVRCINVRAFGAQPYNYYMYVYCKRTHARVCASNFRCVCGAHRSLSALNSMDSGVTNVRVVGLLVLVRWCCRHWHKSSIHTSTPHRGWACGRKVSYKFTCKPRINAN